MISLSRHRGASYTRGEFHVPILLSLMIHLKLIWRGLCLGVTIFLSLDASAVAKFTLTEVAPAKFSLNLPSTVDRIRAVVERSSGSDIAISIILDAATSERKLVRDVPTIRYTDVFTALEVSARWEVTLFSNRFDLFQCSVTGTDPVEYIEYSLV
jgi:hypothetical protein